MARALRRWHWRLCWALGGLLAFQGLTGTAIVFRPELDRALHPAAFGLLAPGPPLPPARLLAAAQAAFAGKGEVTALVLPARPGEPAVAHVTFGPERHAEASVDPATGRAFAPRVYEGSLLGTLYELHNMYVLRDVGYRGVGVAGLLMLASVLAGVRLAWPRRGGLARALAPPPAGAHPVRALRDTHARLGLVAAPLLVMALATGVWMSLGDLARPALGAFGAVEPRLDHPPASRAGALAPSERALAAAAAALPDGSAGLTLSSGHWSWEGRSLTALTAWSVTPLLAIETSSPVRPLAQQRGVLLPQMLPQRATHKRGARWVFRKARRIKGKLARPERFERPTLRFVV